jgi:DNA-directed RNA polymerase I subunit RPA2
VATSDHIDIESIERMKENKKSRTQNKTVSAVQTCPSFSGGHLPAAEDVARLRTLTEPHVESFNYFLEHGLKAGIQDMEPAEVDLLDPKQNTTAVNSDSITTVQFWMENVSVAKPAKAAPTGKSASNKLLPRECRERGLMYAGALTGTFCYRMVERRNGVEIPNKVHKLLKTFGDMPIMVLSQACHLKDASPKELTKLKEEVCTSG